MNTPNNKRSQETLQKIDEAFATLLQEKSLHEIEVSELCELAEINRRTFYAHYDDVSALAKAFTEMTEKMIQSPKRMSDLILKGDTYGAGCNVLRL